MSRTRVPAGLVVALGLTAGGEAVAQQPAMVPGLRAVGLQPQVGASPYQTPSAAASSYGVNPFAAPAPLAPVAPPAYFAARQAQPVAVLPPVVPNNPPVFNPGGLPPFPVAIPPAGVIQAGRINFNPVFVARPAVVSARHTHISPGRSPGGDDLPLLTPVPNPPGETQPTTNPSAGLIFPAEPRFLPWQR